jgi:hypothetical protein
MTSSATPINITSEQILEAAAQISHSGCRDTPVEQVAIALQKWLEVQIEDFLGDPDFATWTLGRKTFLEGLSASGSGYKQIPLLQDQDENEGSAFTEAVVAEVG